MIVIGSRGASPDKRGKERRGKNRACRRGQPRLRRRNAATSRSRPGEGPPNPRSCLREPFRMCGRSVGQSPCRELHEESPAIAAIPAARVCRVPRPWPGMSSACEIRPGRPTRQRRFLLRRVRVTPASPPPSSNSVAGSGTGAGLDRLSSMSVTSQLGTPKPLSSPREIRAVPRAREGDRAAALVHSEQQQLHRERRRYRRNPERRLCGTR
jgi:hypothetical protein